MSDRDWDAEMKKIDQAIARAPAAPAPGAKPAAGPGNAATSSRATGAAPTTTNFGVFMRLSLTVVLGIAIAFWPYSRCGMALAAYLGAVAALVTAGVWSAIWTWRHRASRGHVLSLLIVLWGLVLAGIDILPRTGYAVPTAAHPAHWGCG